MGSAGFVGWLQDGVVSVGARGIGWMTPNFRERVARQMATHWLASDDRFNTALRGNLRRAFPGRSGNELKDLAALNAWRTARAQLDHFWAWHASRAQIEAAVQIGGLEHLQSGQPTVLAGAHQLGFEVTLMRLSMDVEGALVYDPGATPLPHAARRAWSRFRPQEVIAARGGLRAARAAVRAGKPLLVLADEPAQGQPAHSVQVLGTQMRFSPLVAFLARHCGARVLWLDIRQLEAGRYRAELSAPMALGDVVADEPCARAMAARLERALRADPAGYWWGRKSVGAAAGSKTAQQIGTKTRAMGGGHSSVAGDAQGVSESR